MNTCQLKIIRCRNKSFCFTPKSVKSYLTALRGTLWNSKYELTNQWQRPRINFLFHTDRKMCIGKINKTSLYNYSLNFANIILHLEF